MNSEINEESVEHSTELEFASAIVACASDNNLPATIVFNGLAIAAGSMLIDYVSDEDGNVDEMSLKYAVNNFVEGLNKAVALAAQHVKGIAEANNAEAN